MVGFRRLVSIAGRWGGAVRWHVTGTAGAAPPKRALMRLTLLSASGGALLGLGYSAYTHYDINNTQLALRTARGAPPSQPDYDKLNIVPTKTIVGSLNVPMELVLFQYQTCPFCCKVRAFLDYNGFSYKVVEVDAVLRQSIKWSKYKKVPILLVKTEKGYKQLNDSTVIISILSTYLLGKNQDLGEVIDCYPSVSYVDDDGKNKDEILNKYFLMYQNLPADRVLAKLSDERRWRKWTDDTFVHMLSPNVYRTVDEALQAFNWFANVGEWRQHFPAWEVSLMVNVGAYAMWLIGNRLKKKHNLKDDVRLSLYDECNQWTRELKRNGSPYMGGESPDLSDLAVYGVLSSIEGCDAFKDTMDHTKIGIWYYRMKNHVDSRKGTVAA
ncbi:prostaglandin E synthase Su(P) [Arctopsyche grandis]|uniref:prostaglandin E synthase Su(P) n=1 Tax=Arctopsyche grandis TaxID=121162 RepID=UPI00406DA425